MIFDVLAQGYKLIRNRKLKFQVFISFRAKVFSEVNCIYCIDEHLALSCVYFACFVSFNMVDQNVMGTKERVKGGWALTVYSHVWGGTGEYAALCGLPPPHFRSHMRAFPRPWSRSLPMLMPV